MPYGYIIPVQLCSDLKGRWTDEEKFGRKIHWKYIKEQETWLFRKWRTQTMWWLQNWILRHICKISIFWAVLNSYGYKICKKCKYFAAGVFLSEAPSSPSFFVNGGLAILKDWIWPDTECKTPAEYGELNQREGERGNRGEYRSQISTNLLPINSNKHLPQSPFTGKFF